MLAAVGTVVAGVGFGASALACFGTFARLAAPAERGELFSVAYVIAYLAFSIPAVIAGLASTSFGLRAHHAGLRPGRGRPVRRGRGRPAAALPRAAEVAGDPPATARLEGHRRRPR